MNNILLVFLYGKIDFEEFSLDLWSEHVKLRGRVL